METLTLKLAKTRAVKATRILHIALSAMLALSMLTYSSCDNPPPPTPEEVLSGKLLNKTWTVQSVTVDGVDKTSLFTGMSVRFTATGYTVTNPNPVWPASGSWSVNEAATTLTRNDNLSIQIECTDTSLTLTLSWTKTTLGPGRVSSIAGTHVFVFGS